MGGCETCNNLIHALNPCTIMTLPDFSEMCLSDQEIRVRVVLLKLKNKHYKMYKHEGKLSRTTKQCLKYNFRLFFGLIE